MNDDYIDGCRVMKDGAAVKARISDKAAEALAVKDDDFGEELEEEAPADAPIGALMAAASVSGRELDIAQRLRVGGFNPIEVAGWRDRGDATLNGRGFVTHHTAGAKTGVSPSLGICVNGRPDLSGPLCNVFQDRLDRVHVVASGRANHAGSGGWRGLEGNSSVIGLEVEHPGTFPLSAKRVKVAARIVAAIMHGKPEAAANTCQHHEWSTAGKVDIGVPRLDGDSFRTLVKQELALLDDVVVWRIVFPTGVKTTGGVWVRKTVVVRNPANWVDDHPKVLERRGKGGTVTITPTRT